MLKLIAPALALIFTPFAAIAQDVNPAEEVKAPSAVETRAADVLALIKGEQKLQDVFAPVFLNAISPEQFTGLSNQVTAQFGQPLAVENLKPFGPHKAAFDIRFETGIGRIEMALSPAAPNRITELLIRRIDPIGDDLSKITEELSALPGEVSVYFGPLDGTDPVIAINTDRQMAIGSTFKLYVLSALARKIAAGDAKWDDTLPLTRPSFPSGMTQEWPQGSPLTLQSHAALMISISDNTTTDSLVDFLGQEFLAKEVRDSGHSQPNLNAPFLTTRQMFTLKTLEDEQLEMYRKLSVPKKQFLVQELAARDIEQDDVEKAFANGPHALDIEWFASAQDIRKLLAHMPKGGDDTSLEIMAINPSAPDTFFAAFPSIYYKGGSEPGVLNFTWLLKDKQSEWQVLTMSWNNPDAVLEEQRFELLAQRIFATAQ
ncbi:MAG: serine hydrolase [Marinomonas sp.]